MNLRDGVTDLMPDTPRGFQSFLGNGHACLIIQNLIGKAYEDKCRLTIIDLSNSSKRWPMMAASCKRSM